MKCARLHLQERSKVKMKTELPTIMEKPRRYCQKRLVNPDHEEDPRWMDLWDRFHCNMNCEQMQAALESAREQQDNEDMVLTVQTLKFQGDVDQTKRPRTSFKYKTITDGNKHRMFVKQIVNENEFSDEDRSSQLTCYYFDDYVKYLCSDRSRPTSGRSTIFLRGISNYKENKAIQVEIAPIIEDKKVKKVEPKPKAVPKKVSTQEVKEVRDIVETIENTKITYQKTGKRKSLTISRTQSPETVQVIRVDVVCNYPNSSLSDYDDIKRGAGSPDRSKSKLENIGKNNHFNKYLLTNSIKSLDESLSGGSKVTLLCKTFKLSDRMLKASDKPLRKSKKNGRKSAKHMQKYNQVKIM
ncbi:uncharacterized protein LOC142986666 [Anticarsia gemmatalis]|uniref:uncharacterized protein LOC142986666 n=1 Tax=Anticarsia gemmatalis TaxID=129554 RepID=UPI003F776272